MNKIHLVDSKNIRPHYSQYSSREAELGPIPDFENTNILKSKIQTGITFDLVLIIDQNVNTYIVFA